MYAGEGARLRMPQRRHFNEELAMEMRNRRLDKSSAPDAGRR
jgi:hypothetical protein